MSLPRRNPGPRRAAAPDASCYDRQIRQSRIRKTAAAARSSTMSERFYLPSPLRGVVTLDGPEAHHLSHVLRRGPGDEVTLFDGRGTRAEARIDSVSKRSVLLSVLRAQTTEPEAPPRLVLATAVPK